MVLFHIMVSIAGGILSIILMYLIYQKFDAGIWGFIASFFPDMPVFFLVPLGVTNIETTLIVSHTVGMFVFPIFLVIIDLLIIEIMWARYILWMPYPKSLRLLEKINSIVLHLERYNAIPRPIRLPRVYVVGVLAGGIHLVLNIMIGVF